MKNLTVFLAVLMGVSCFTGQLLFAREFLIIFHGNELTIGLILANWLLLEALGSFIFGSLSGRLKRPEKLYGVLQILAGILMPLSIYAGRAVKPFLGLMPGEGMGIIPVIGASFLVMLPLSVLLGSQFPLVCRLYQDARRRRLDTAIGTGYALEGAGFFSGGIILTFLVIPRVSTMTIAFIIGFLNIFFGGILLSRPCKRFLRVTAVIFLLTAGAAGIGPGARFLHNASLRRQWNPLELVDYKNSIYGNTAVTRQEEQYVLYYDGLPLMSIPVPDIAFTEDIVHFPMSAADKKDTVLVLGAGLGGIINNVLAYPVSRVDYAELDPLLIDMAEKYPAEITVAELNDPRVNIHYLDGRFFLRAAKRRFDVIIMNFPAPGSLQLNRYFTQEFFRLVRERLSDNGIFCFTVPGSLSYLSREQAELNKCLWTTLKSVFPEADVIPGDNNIYLAGRGKLPALTAERVITALEQNQIQSRLFTEFYAAYRLDAHYKEWFFDSLQKTSARLNRDFQPAGVKYSLALWNTLFSPRFQRFYGAITPGLLWRIFSAIFFICAAAALTVFALKKTARPVQRTALLTLTMTTGFCGFSVNLILALGLQIFYGYVYLYLGLLISGFMLGLTAGSMLMTRALAKIKRGFALLLGIDTAFMLFTVFILLMLGLLKAFVEKGAAAVWIIVPLFASAALTGLFAGGEFPLANKLYLENRRERKQEKNILYAVDMLGSFAGSLLTAILLIPVLGITHTLLTLLVLKAGVLLLYSTSCVCAAGKRP